MLKSQPFKIFSGFGDGSQYGQGEVLHSQGFQKTQNGATPNWKIASNTDSNGFAGLALPQFITQAAPSGVATQYGVDANGQICQWNGSSWVLAYIPDPTNFATNGNGLIGDQKGRLLYIGNRYLGKFDGTADYTTGTIAVTNGSNAVVGTGTTFTSSMVNKRIVINSVWYTISVFTDATHITLSTNYTGTTASGLSYAIKVGWTDQFKDFGSAISPASTPCHADTYEDWVVICRGANLALYNVQDDSFNATQFTLPSNFTTRATRAGRNGILTGANLGNRSILFLWDAFATRSIAPWIWLNGNIQSIVPYNGNWIVTTNRRVIWTNGYTAATLAPIFDAKTTDVYLNVLPQGTEIINDSLLIANSANSVNRIRPGVWILNLIPNAYGYTPQAGLWDYVPVAGLLRDLNMGAIFFDSSFTIHLGWQATFPSNVNNFGTLSNNNASSAYVITEPLGEGNNKKSAEAVKLIYGTYPAQFNSYPLTFNVTVKIYNFKRQLWNYAQQKVAATTYNQLTVNGTLSGFNDAQVGDEVTILEGANAGLVAHITSISGLDTATEVWTLDTTFANLTEQNALISVQPFHLLGKYTLTNVTELKDLYFYAKNSILGQKFALKILVDGMTNSVPELISGELIYNDLG